MTPKLYEEIVTCFRKKFGPFAGWAQAYLFTNDLPSFSAESLSALATASPSSSSAVVPLVVKTEEEDAPVTTTSTTTALRRVSGRKRKAVVVKRERDGDASDSDYRG